MLFCSTSFAKDKDTAKDTKKFDPVTNKIFKKYRNISEVPSQIVYTLLARRVLFPLTKNYLSFWKKTCCEKGDYYCRFYGLSVLNNGNISTAKDLFSKSCIKYDGEACLLYYQLSTTKKEKEMYKLYANDVCEKKGSECFAYERILFAEKKTNEVISLAKNNCIGRSLARSCKNLYGGFLKLLEMKEINPATELKKRCDLKDQTSCFQRTLIDEFFKFVDFLLILVESCKAGIFEACYGIIEAVKKNKKFLDNPEFAKIVQFICSLGNMEVCKIASTLDKKKYVNALKQLEYINCNYKSEKSCYENLINFKPKKMVDFKKLKIPEQVREFIQLNLKKCSFALVDKVKFDEGFVKEGYRLICERKNSRTRIVLYLNG